MVQAVCPVCGKSLEGDFQTVTKHASMCVRKKAKKSPPKRDEDNVPDCRPLPVLPITIRLDKPIPSQNRNLGRHWSIKNREVKAWGSLLLPFITTYQLQARLFRWSNWIIERRYAHPNQEYDQANLVGGAKHLVDALVNLQVMYDDKPQYFKAEYLQTKVDVADAGTFITLLEARP